MKTVIKLPLSDSYTPEQALLSVLDEAKENSIADVLVVGYYKDGSLLVRPSKMLTQDAFWLCEKLKQYILSLQP